MRSLLLGARVVIAIAFSAAAGRLPAQIMITEVMYNAGPADEEGRKREFIEVFNTSAEPLDLSGYSFSRGITYTFPPNTWLNGHTYLAVCADPTYIRSTYSITNTAGPWDPAAALANGGETISIVEPSGAEVAKLRYNDRGKWPAAADGTGHSLAIDNPYRELDDPDSWSHSSARGGSPGKVNPAPGAKPVRFNEGLIWTSGERWIEIYNPSDSAVSLTDYYMTDDPQDLDKIRLGATASVPAKGRLALSDVALGLNFAPVPNPPDPGVGRTFVALVDPAGTRVVDAYTFEPKVAEKSEARYPDGNEDWSDAAEPTRGTPNQVNVETDIVINEIMYHSHDDELSDEFLELYNRGGQAVAMEGCRFSQGIDFTFPAVTIPAGGYLVVARDPDRIRTVYGLPASAVVGPAQDPSSLADFGVLANGGERLTLVDTNGNVMDTLRYYDGGDWPRWADGLGSSLELIDPFADNASAIAWDASDDSAKAAVETFSYSGKHHGGESELHMLLQNQGICVVDDIELRSGGGSLVVDDTFVDFGATWKYKKGTVEPSSPVTAWRATAYSDTTWSSGAAPVGYGEPDIVTSITDMQNTYLTVYFRRSFPVADRNSVDKLFLDIRYDDGFYAYLNGTQVASRNATGSAFDAPAASVLEPTQETIDITAFKASLVNGTNVLAVQLHNANLGSTDVLVNARLVSGHIETGGVGANLIGNGAFETNDAGWIIQGNHTPGGRTDLDPITGSGSLKLIATGRGDNKVNRIECEATQSMNTTDTYTVSFKARWVVGARSLLTHGYQNLDTTLSKAHALAVPDDLGTPGAINGVTQRQVAQGGTSDMGPTISRVSQSPAVPQASEAVTVRARIADPAGVASAKVLYYLNTPGPAQPTQVNMTDPDGDGEYTASIPGRTIGTKVLFAIQATDTNGKVERYPPDVTLRSHPLVLDPTPGNPVVQKYCIYRHDTRNIDPSNPFHKYRFIMHDRNEAYLDQRELLSNDPVDGSFVFGGTDIYYNSRIRFSGSPWARGKWSSFRLRFPDDKPLHGQKYSFSLDTVQGDPMSARERLSNYLFRANSRPGAPVPYASNRKVHFWANSRDLGTIDHVEVPNSETLAKWWPDDDNGDFFEMDDRFEFNDGGGRISSRDGRLLYPPYNGLADDQEEYRWYFNLRRDEDGDNFANLIDWAKIMDPGDTPNAQFDQLIDEYMNVESFLRTWAVRMNTDDWDTWGTARGKNTYFYRPPNDARWHIIPWDMELTYGNVDAFGHPTGSTGGFGFSFGEVNRLLDRPRLRRLYYGILKEMVDGPFRSTYLNPYMTRLDSLGFNGGTTALGKSGGFVDQRRTRILSWINSVVSPQVNFTITSPNNGNATTVSTPTVNLAGSAPVEVFEIAIANDRIPYEEGDVPPAVFSATSMTGWAVTGVPLAPGANSLTVIGYNSLGVVVDQDSITVTSTASFNPPAISALDPASVLPGDVVTITGSELHNGLQVFFGSTAAAAVQFNEATDPTHILATVPSLAAAVYAVKVRNVDGKESNTLNVTVSSPPPEFIRGDANMDQSADIADAVKILLHLLGGQAVTCRDALDVDDNGSLNVTDATVLLNYLYREGAAPSAPFPARGQDATGTDALDCAAGLP